jgi:hypothetical protein
LNSNSTNEVNWTAFIVPAVAIYGALLSTINLIAARRDKKAKIRIQMSLGYLAFLGSTSPEMALIEIINVGRDPVTINGIGMKLPDKKALALLKPQSNVSFPHQLDFGKSCTVWTSVQELADQLCEEGYSRQIKLMPYCRDQIGREFRGKKMKFNSCAWSKADS